MSRKQERAEVEIARKRLPLKRMIHGKEIREVMEEFEKFRLQFNEQEFFHRAKIYLSFDQGESIASVRRMETDNEYNKRLAQLRKEEAERLERKRIREEKARIREERKKALAEEEAKRQRLEAIDIVKQAARKLGLTAKDLVDM